MKVQLDGDVNVYDAQLWDIERWNGYFVPYLSETEARRMVQDMSDTLDVAYFNLFMNRQTGKFSLSFL